MEKHSEVVNIAESNEIYEKELPSTPLYDMFCKHIIPIVAFCKRDQTRDMVSNVMNMFCLQLILIECTMFITTFVISDIEVVLAFGVASASLVCGFYSMATRDPLGMILYSILNFIGMVASLFYIFYTISSISFALLLLNQIRAFGYIVEFGREKLNLKNQDLIHSLSNIYQSQV